MHARATTCDTCSDLGRLRSDGTTERVEDLQGRTDIVHNHFKELFTDPLHKEILEWIGQR